MSEIEASAAVPQWTLNDFAAGDAPYKYIYDAYKKSFEFGENRALQLAAAEAKRVGYVGVKRSYDAYKRSINRVSGDDSGDAYTDFDGQPIALNCSGYSCSDAGIFSRSQDDSFAEVCTHPILPVARLVNVDTGDVKIKLAFRRGKIWRELIVDKSSLASAQKVVQIAAGGVDVTSETARDMVKYLARLEALNYDRLPEYHSASRLGWIKKDTFAPYMENLLFDGDDNFRHLFRCVRQEGDAGKWEALAKRIRSSGTLPARVVLAASVASALVRPLDALPFVVHLWGGTGNGKTVALMLAASVWGAPGVGDLCKSFNATANANELTADFLGALPLCLDELQIVQGDRAGSDKLIYTLTEGSGKGRATKTGGIQRTTSWRNVIITTGESPITTDQSGGGAVNRVLNINCRDDMIFSDAREVAGIVKNNFGWFGRLFVEQLLLAYDQTMEVVKKMQSDIMADLVKTATDKQALSASVLLTADRMAGLLLGDKTHNITYDEIGEFLSAPSDVDANKRAYECLKDVIAGNPARFIPRDTPGGGKEYPGECWGCIEQDGKVAYVIATKLNAILDENHFSATAFTAWAARNDALYRKGDSRHLSVRKRIAGNGGVNTRCYAIRLDDADDDFVDVSDDPDVTQQGF